MAYGVVQCAESHQDGAYFMVGMPPLNYPPPPVFPRAIRKGTLRRNRMVSATLRVSLDQDVSSLVSYPVVVNEQAPSPMSVSLTTERGHPNCLFHPIRNS